MIGVSAVLSLIAFFIGYVVRKNVAESKVKTAERIADRIVSEAEKETDNLKREALLEAKDEAYKYKEKLEREVDDRKRELKNQEHSLSQKRNSLEEKTNAFRRKEQDIKRSERQLEKREQSLKTKEEGLSKKIDEQNRMLEQISGLTAEQAKEILMKNLVAEVEHEAARTVKEIKDKASAEGEREARNIISLAIQRCASDHVANTTVSVVELPNDEMKGRIIGREGRNIRSLEAVTGVDLVVDDTPEAVIISSFDPVRREVARRSLEQLILDGRIHPTRIEEIVNKNNKDIEKHIKEVGEEAVFEINLQDVNPELVKLLGRLEFRTSYGQNVLKHSKEVAYLCGVMAGELGADFEESRRAGLFHDIGKAVDHEVEGTHSHIGADILRRYDENETIISGAATHHGVGEPNSVEAVLVAAADAISAARPGARRESLEHYIKRINQLEELADGFTGVSKSYAIQAGREIRIIVEQDKVSDTEAVELARRIAKRIEDDMDYPGKIKVVVVRETRSIEYAK
ncbi:MAG: ribonuclease Y [bacterium]|nr:ribonuclease Y [bacterium]